MKYTLLSKKEVERNKFSEKAGMINIYTCPNCNQSVMYLYVADGVTPMMITCHHCGGDSFSQLSAMRQPTLIWYRPKDLDEITRIADSAYIEMINDDNGYRDEPEEYVRETILSGYIIHYNNGGLFARKL